MVTINESSRDTIQRMRDNIAPGASGWDVSVEGTGLRGLAHQAQIDLGVVDPLEQFHVEVRNEVEDIVTRQMAPGYTDQIAVETAANAGQMIAAIIAAETFFIDQVADEQAP